MGFTTNTLVQWLLSRSYGQGGTVAVPSPGETPVVNLGKFPAGVGDVLSRLEAKYIGIEPFTASEPVEWCFLVGGPGNGKSEALRYLAQSLLGKNKSALELVLRPRSKGEPVPRTVPVGWPVEAAPLNPGIEIVFINDASIPRSGMAVSGQPGSLLLDLADGIERFLTNETPVVMFGNVNRGIIVEEEGKLDNATVAGTDASGFAARVIQWLANPPATETTLAGSLPGQAQLQTIVPVDPSKPFYGQFRIPLITAGAHHDVLVHVVFLDVLSLLEPVPGVAVAGRAIDFTVEPPSVAAYEPLGGFSDTLSGITRSQTTAGELLSEIINPLNWQDRNCIDPATKSLCDAHATCPFAQNSRWLQEPTLRDRVLDVFRAGEIAAGRRMSYRDLLGHVSLAVIGQAENDWLTGMHPCRWVEQETRNLRNGEKRAAAELVEHRIYANLFPPPDAAAWKRAMVNALQGDNVYSVASSTMSMAGASSRVLAFERAFNDLDPSRDTESWDGIRAKVLDAVESLDVEQPSTKVSTLASLLAPIHSEVEQFLDQSVREEIVAELARGQKTAQTRAKLLRKWRSTLLLRQVGLALGTVSFAPALRAWLAEQANAINGGAPMELGMGVRALLLPPANTGQFWLAPFRPRAYAMTTDLPPNTVLVPIQSNDLRVEISPRGDTLVAELVRMTKANKPPDILALLIIDLSIAREAILHVDGRLQSFTEIGNSAFARIERARAALVSRARTKETTAHFTDNTGTLYRVSPNPAGATPLRVQKV